jgi:hypothetical protein
VAGHLQQLVLLLLLLLLQQRQRRRQQTAWSFQACCWQAEQGLCDVSSCRGAKISNSERGRGKLEYKIVDLRT